MNLQQAVKHATSKLNEAPLHERLVDIYSGNLVEYVKNSMSEELSAKSFQIASKRIAVINLIERITKKLSKVYTDKPRRTTSDAKDTEILETYENSIGIQFVMAQAETLLNLNKHFALEPYIKDGKIQVRVLAPHEFTVYSDDEQDPKNPTALIKFMGSVQKGKHIANVFWMYTKEEYIEVDSDGVIYKRLENPYGVIPFVYCSVDEFRLQPKPDVDSFHNGLLVPKLLTDLNYAVQFQSHSIMYGIDLDPKNLNGGPDAFWSIKSEEGENKNPSIGMLSPTVDVDKVLSLISFTLGQWLESKGIKPGSMGTMQAQNAASAVSKIVDEADTSQAVQKNRLILVECEKSLWELVGTIHNTLVGSDQLEIKTGLSAPFKVSVSFAEQKPISDPQEKRDELKFQLDNKLISYMRALKQAHPDLSDEELLKLKAEIEEESRQTSKPQDPDEQPNSGNATGDEQ